MGPGGGVYAKLPPRVLRSRGHFCANVMLRLDIKDDDGFIGPSLSRDEAENDAKETLGIQGG
jgi:hypothetical protein